MVSVNLKTATEATDVGNLSVMVSLPRYLKDQLTLADASMME
jgi:hypothetical protein